MAEPNRPTRRPRGGEKSSPRLNETDRSTGDRIRASRSAPSSQPNLRVPTLHTPLSRGTTRVHPWSFSLPLDLSMLIPSMLGSSRIKAASGDRRCGAL